MNVERPGSITCFGEVLVRLSASAGTRLSNAGGLAVDVGGAEANVAAVLAQLGHEVELVSALPSSALGELCVADLRRYGIGTRQVLRKDGRVGLYFFERQGSGGRIIYDRDASVFQREAGVFDWPNIAARTRWFHLSGINLALGQVAATAALEAARAMKQAGVPISFDVNHRASLWDGKSDAELSAVREMAAMTDIVFASAFDIARLLDIAPAADRQAPNDETVRSAFGRFGGLQRVASTRRSLVDGDQLLSCRIDRPDRSYETKAAPVRNIIDRIGSGDAFAGAMIHGILCGASDERCAALGLAAAVMKHAVAGDRWVGTLEDLEAFNPFLAQDIQR